MNHNNPVQSRIILVGVLLGQLREKKGLTQVEVARISGIARETVGRIESGERMAKVEKLKAILDACDASYREKHFILASAGYIPPTEMPNLREIQKELLKIPELSNPSIPTYVADYRSLFWGANAALRTIANPRDSIDMTEILRKRLTIHDVTYNSDYKIKDKIVNKAQVFTAGMYNTTFMGLYHQHEPYFRNFIANMRKKLSTDDFEDFYKYWEKYDDFEQQPIRIFTGEEDDKGSPLAFKMRDSQQVINFHIRNMNIWGLGGFFNFVMYVPADDYTKDVISEYETSRWYWLWDYMNHDEQQSLEDNYLKDGEHYDQWLHGDNPM